MRAKLIELLHHRNGTLICPFIDYLHNGGKVTTISCKEQSGDKDFIAREDADLCTLEDYKICPFNPKPSELRDIVEMLNDC